MIKQVEELRAELQGGILVNPAHTRHFRDRRIEVELAGPQENADARITEVGSTGAAAGGSDDRDGSKRRKIRGAAAKSRRIGARKVAAAETATARPSVYGARLLSTVWALQVWSKR